MDDCTQPVGTQDVYDPRRMGMNNSGLNGADISDVLCILHPCSPAAFKIVSHTAERSPQNVLQNHSFNDYQDSFSQQDVEEAETFIIGSDRPHAMDLALRFSANLIRPEMGFVFGRNPSVCDIVLDTDTSKRISNMHFRIFINPSGVLMLGDASTNGTIVDEVMLKGKPGGKEQWPHPARMLSSGSIIQILSPKQDEIVKFIVRIPNREGFELQYQQNFEGFMQRVKAAEVLSERARAQQQNGAAVAKRLFPPPQHKTSTTSIKAPISNMHFGMHWSGGEKYSVVGNIGKGAFATVYQVATKTDGQVFAAKELDKRRCMKNGILDRKVTNEMQIMQSVNHPNIVQYMEYRDFEQYLYIIMEFVPGGDLQQYLSSRGALVEPLANRMASQVLDALEYLHRKKITHRDIKPDNILLSDLDPQTFTVKLSDFGLSKVVADDKETFLKTFCGTLLYCAPEVFPHYDAHVAGKGKKRTRHSGATNPQKFHSYSQSVDIWSFAAVLWYSLCLTPPFEGVSDATGRGMFEKIMMTPLDPADLIRKGISDDAVTLLVDMLNTDPAARPNPVACMQYKWFGGTGHAVETDTALGAIVEEHEADGPDVASLSLDERDSSQASQTSQISLNSADIKFLDPRQSKRFKSDAFVYRDQGSIIDSSPEVIFDKIPIVNQVADQQVQPSSAQRKLFGEISHSALTSSGVLPVTNDKTQGYDSHEEELAMQNGMLAVKSLNHPQGIIASPSLDGAESLVRELKMDSPGNSGSSPAAEPNEPTTPNTPNVRKVTMSSNDNGNEITPRALPQSTFNRQINIPFPPSLFWESSDPTTHNAEYASKVSGHDFARNPSYIFPAQDTLGGSLTDKDDEPTDGETEGSAPQSEPEFARPRPHLGKLVTTNDSFVHIDLTLTRRREEWGRDPLNTQVYLDKHDVRVPKRAIIIWFHAADIENVPEEDDKWVKLPGLRALITTESRGGITVNGVFLPKNKPECAYYGRLYSGDEIGVCWKAGEPLLKFKCDFFHGTSKVVRPGNGPRFLVEEDRKMKKITNGIEQENALAGAASSSLE